MTGGRYKATLSRAHPPAARRVLSYSSGPGMAGSGSSVRAWTLQRLRATEVTLLDNDSKECSCQCSTRSP